MDPTLNRRCRLIHVLFIVLIMSLVLQIVGYATPGWICMYSKQQEKKVKTSMGLYYMVLCISEKCSSYRYGDQTGGQGYDDLIGGKRESFDWAIDLIMGEYRIMTSIALVATVISCILTGVYMCQSLVKQYPAKNRIKLLLTSLSGLLAGSLALASAGKMGKHIADTERYLELVDRDEIIFNFPYSLLATGAGGFLILCGSLVQIGYLLLDRNSRNSTNSQGIVLQQNDAMAMLPQTLDMYNPHFGQGVVGQPYFASPPAYNEIEMPLAGKEHQLPSTEKCQS